MKNKTLVSLFFCHRSSPLSTTFHVSHFYQSCWYVIKQLYRSYVATAHTAYCRCQTNAFFQVCVSFGISSLSMCLCMSVFRLGNVIMRQKRISSHSYFRMKNSFVVDVFDAWLCFEFIGFSADTPLLEFDRNERWKKKYGPATERTTAAATAASTEGEQRGRKTA